MSITEKQILVTGGAGFIGSHLVRRLLKEGNRVAVLVRDATDTRRIDDLLPRLKVLRDDLSDLGRLKKLLQNFDFRGIYHLAGAKSKGGVSGPEEELVRTNTTGTINLVNALEDDDYEFFINSGTTYEYGAHDKPLAEDEICQPVGAYAISKLAATLYCQATARSAGKPIITFRIFTLYGPDMDRGQLFNEVVVRALQNKEITLTQPEISRDFIFIDDLVDLYIEAAGKARALAGEIFNAGSGKATTLKDLVDQVRNLTGSRSPIKWGAVKSSIYDRGCQEANMQKTFKTFAWRPVHDLDFGISKTAEWFKSPSVKY